MIFLFLISKIIIKLSVAVISEIGDGANTLFWTIGGSMGNALQTLRLDLSRLFLKGGLSGALSGTPSLTGRGFRTYKELSQLV